mgnify:FL=1
MLAFLAAQGRVAFAARGLATRLDWWRDPGALWGPRTHDVERARRACVELERAGLAEIRPSAQRGAAWRATFRGRGFRVGLHENAGGTA